MGEGRDTPTPPPGRMVRLAWVFYVPMIATAPFIAEPAAWRVADPLRVGLGLGLAAVLGAAVIGLSRWLGHRTGWGRGLRAEFAAVLGGLGSRQILVLSLLSAFGEEILFRGVLHGRLGLVPTALLFGLFHFPVRRRLVPWTVFAVVLGLVLGGMTTAFGSLWPAILLHFAVNYFNIHELAAEGAPGPQAPEDRESRAAGEGEEG